MKNRVRNEAGQGMVEYILIVVFVVVAGLLIWRAFGETVATKVQAAEEKVRGVDTDEIAGKIRPTGEGE